VKTIQQVTFRLSADTHRRLKILAAQEGKSIQAILAGLIHLYLEQQEPV